METSTGKSNTVGWNAGCAERRLSGVGSAGRKPTAVRQKGAVPRLHWIALVWLIWVSVSPALAELYRWRDDAGKIHLTDNPDTIPPAYRARARASGADTPAADETPSADAQPAPPQPLPADR